MSHTTTQASLGQVPKGSDIKVPFRYEGSDEAPVNLNDLSGMIVLLYYEKDGSTLETFDTGTTYEPIVFDDAVNGEFHVKVQSDTTETANSGWVVGEVKIAESDQDWNDGVFHDIMKTGKLFNLVESKTTTQNP